MSGFILNPTVDGGLLDRIWDRVSGSSSFWSHLEGSSKDAFIAETVKSPVLVLLDFGLARFDIGSEPGLAQVHAVFWSPSLFKHFDDMHRALKAVMEKYCLLGVEAIVPKGQKSLRKIAERIGFHWVGTISGHYNVRGQLYDADRYLILKEEE